MNSATLRLPGVLDSIDKLTEFVRAAAHQACLSKKAEHGLLLATDEIATNVITHGYQEAERIGEIEARIDTDPEFVILTLTDWGVYFDPRTQPEPDSLDAPLETRGVGGLGIFLAMMHLDAFAYERQADRNVNVLKIRRTPAAEL